jgi:copper(I)-binding protein
MKTFSLLLAGLLSLPLAAAELSVDEGYLRATPPGQMMSAAFMTLSNDSDKTITLTGGTSKDVASIEIHNHAMVDGVMSMQRIEGLKIDAGEKVELAPGGLHVMLIGLKKSLVDGENFTFDIVFKDGSTQTLKLPIKSIVN